MWDLDIPAGRVTVLMGAGGCGKSTLAAVAAGLYPENGGFLAGGQIRWFGTDLAAMDPQQARAPGGHAVPEPRPAVLHGKPLPGRRCDGPRASRAAAAELGVQALLDRPLHTLSGGEKQRAALACLYVMECRCLLLDECFANLDRDAARELMEMPAPDAPAGAHHHRDRPPARAVAGYRRRVHPAQGGRPGGGPRAAPGQPAAAPRAVCGAGPVLPRPAAALCAQGGNGGGHPAFRGASASRRAKRSRSGGFSAAPPRPRRFCWTARRRSSPKGR